MLVKIRILDNSDVLHESESTMVILPGAEGEFAVLYGHINMIAQLASGVVSIVLNDSRQRIKIRGGFAHVTFNSVEVIV